MLLTQQHPPHSTVVGCLSVTTYRLHPAVYVNTLEPVCRIYWCIRIFFLSLSLFLHLSFSLLTQFLSFFHRPVFMSASQQSRVVESVVHRQAWQQLPGSTWPASGWAGSLPALPECDADVPNSCSDIMLCI